MLRKSLIGLLTAVTLLVLLAAAVGAQSETDEPTEAASIEPMSASIVQAVPLTLTVNVPGPDGMRSVEVPIVLSLDIRIALGNVLTTTVVVTPELSAPAEAAPTEVPLAPTPVAPTPTPVPPTPTPEPPTPTPTQAAPTPRPVGQTPAPEPTQEAEATPAPEEEATPESEEVMIPPESCTDPRSVIFEPNANDVLSGTVEVYGVANHELFSYYKLEYMKLGGETEGEFAFLMDSKEKVIDGLLAELDTTALDNGKYILRLTVVDNTGNFPPQCSVPVEIAN